MNKKYIEYILLAVLSIFILTFEQTIGVPFLFLFLVFRIALSMESYSRLLLVIGSAFLLSAAISISMVTTLLLLVGGIVFLEKIQSRTILTQATCAAICMTILVFIAELQLFPLSFVYFISIWIVLLLGNGIPKRLSPSR